MDAITNTTETIARPCVFFVKNYAGNVIKTNIGENGYYCTVHPYRNGYPLPKYSAKTETYADFVEAEKEAMRLIDLMTAQTKTLSPAWVDLAVGQPAQPASHPRVLRASVYEIARRERELRALPRLRLAHVYAAYVKGRRADGQADGDLIRAILERQYHTNDLAAWKASVGE